jgi:hypothetical protein
MVLFVYDMLKCYFWWLRSADKRNETEIGLFKLDMTG